MSPIWPRAPRIVVVTGPALSRESGFAPFDPETMPAGLRIEDVVTRAAFERDPERVQAFYNLRRRELQRPAVAPNAAHEALAALDLTRPGGLLTATRNLDDLHERAGALSVIHTHGELLKARCAVCTKVSDGRDDILGGEDCPICGNTGHLRPHIVWAGEVAWRLDAIYEAVSHCSLLMVIGTSRSAEPTAGFLAEARRAGAGTVEFNPQASPAGDRCDERIYGPLRETLPAYVKKLIAEA